MSSRDLTCPECGPGVGPMVPRTSGFFYCRHCGKLEVSPPELTPASEPEQDEKPAVSLADAAGGLTVPDFSEVMVGWRAWGVDPATPAGEVPILQSVTQNEQYWIPKQPMEATCLRKGPKGHKDGQIPLEQCRCGLYAAKSYEHLRSMTYHTYDAEDKGLFHVVGRVSLWGKVIEGSQGWRAQYGYPQELFLPYEAWRLAERLGEAYGVPCKLKNILAADDAADESEV